MHFECLCNHQLSTESGNGAEPATVIPSLGLDLLQLVRRRTHGTARYRLKRTLADMRYPSVAARKELGWEPQVGFEELLRMMVDHDLELARAEKKV